MIKLFSESDHIFSSNGDKIIQPKKAIIRKEDNGSFYLDMETDISIWTRKYPWSKPMRVADYQSKCFF